MRKKNEIFKKFFAIILSVILILMSEPVSLYADIIDVGSDTPNNTGNNNINVGNDNQGNGNNTVGNILGLDGNNDITNGDEKTLGVQLIETNGVLIEPETVHFYVVQENEKKELEAMYSEGIFYLSGITEDTEIELAIDADKDSTYAPYSTILMSLSDDITDVEVTLSEKAPCALAADDCVLEYGDSVSIYEVVKVAENYDGAIDAASQDIGTISVENGLLTAYEVGDAVIEVTATSTDNFSGASIFVPVTIKPKDLGEINADAVEWEPVSWTYNGERSISASGSFGSTAGTLNGEIVHFTAELLADDANAGEKSTTVSTYQSDNAHYTFSLINGPAVTIQPVSAEIELDDKTVEYGDADWTALSNGTVPSWENWVHASCAVSNDFIDAELASLNLFECLDFSVADNSYSVGRIENAVTAYPKNNGGNFVFTVAKNTSVTVLNEIKNGIWDLISFDEKNSRNAYEKDGTVWAAPGSYAAFTIKDTSVYNKILFNTDVFSEDGINVPLDAEELHGTLQLANRENPDIMTDSDAETDGAQAESIPAGAVKIDRTAPEVIIDLGTYAKADDIEFSELPMVRYSKEGYTATVTASDTESGLALETYTILKVEDQNDAESKIRACVRTYQDWESVPVGGQIDVPGTEDGYYLIVVGVSDYVGNASVVASNGVVLDATTPGIVMNGLEDNVCYNDDVAFSVEYNDTTAGIKHVVVKATANGNANVLYEKTFDAPGTIADILKKNHLDVVLPKSLNSNAVLVEAEVEDNAGNTASVTRTVQMDVTDPEITMSFDNISPENGKYFNEKREMTVVFTERNFDPSRAGFEISINGETKRVNADELSGYGITLVKGRVDSEEGRMDNNYTDDRTNTYVYAFGADGNIDADYKITPFMTDISGKEFTGKTEEFTIDEIAPKASVVYTTGGMDFTGNIDAVYTREPVIETIQIEDRNADENGLSLNVTSHVLNGVPQPVEKEAVYENGIYNIEYADDGNYTVCATYKDLAGNSVEIPEKLFTIDSVAPNGGIITRDGENRKLSERLSGEMKFGTFSNQDVHFEYTAGDTVSGISYVMYAFYVPSPDAKNNFRVPVESLEQMDWALWDDDITLKPDAQAVLYAKIVDNAGNVTYLNSLDGVIAEGTAPETPVIDITSEGNIYNGNVPFTITVKDPENGGTYSGIKSIHWSVKNGDTITQSGNYDEAFTDPSARINEYTHEENVVSSLNDSNQVTIIVEASDYAGNKNIAMKQLMVDATVPEISVSFDDNHPVNEKYFNHARTMTVSFKERNFDPALAGFDVTINGETKRTGLYDLGYGITLTSDRVDSEADLDADKYTDNRTNTYVYTFGAEGDIDADYKIVPFITDASGNKNAEVNYGNSYAGEFTIDEVMPNLELFFDADGGFVPGDLDMVYTRNNVIETIAVKERNFDENGLVLNNTGTTLSGFPVQAPSKAVWDGRYTVDAFSEDANYTTGGTYTDLAGNTVTIPKRYFTVDKTAPTGVIRTINGNETKESTGLSEQLRFGTFSNHDITFEYAADDAVSGISYVMYAFHIPSVSAKNTFAVPGLSELEGMDWKLWEDVRVKPDAQAVLYAKIVDKAGNIAYFNAKDGVIAEGTAPDTPDILISVEKAIHNGDVPFTIKVKDSENGGTYSGIRSIHWSVRSAGAVTQSGSYDSEFTNSAARIQESVHKEIVSSSRNNSNDVVITVDAEDYAGNRTSASKRLMIDVTKPKVTVTYDNNTPLNGKYFNSPRTMTVQVNERNFSEEDTLVELTVNNVTKTYKLSALEGLGIRRLNEYTDSEKDKEKTAYTDERVQTIRYTFGGGVDADYKMVFHVKDAAGNTADVQFDGVAAEEFTIDEIAPTLSVVYNNGSVFEASQVKDVPYYSRTPVSATVEVSERNHTGELTLKVSGADLSGKAVDVTADGTWDGNLNTHHYTLNPFTKDANYSFYVTYTDLAGNKADYETRYFTIDATPPTGTLITENNGTKESSSLSTSTSFGTFSNKSVSLRQKNSDATSGVASVMYYIYTPPVTARDTFNLPIDELRNFEWKEWTDVVISPNRQAVVFMKVTDKAGNITYISSADGIIADDVAPAMPVISIASEESVYWKDIPVTISVTEQEAGGTYAGLKNVKWEVRKDGTVTQSGNYADELGSSSRTYSLTKNELISAALNNSNNVVLVVSAEDYAGNVSTASKTFSIDGTAPAVSISYDNNAPLNGKYFNTPRTMTVTYRERNFDPAKAMIHITINGSSMTVPVGSLSGTGISLVSGRNDSQAGRALSQYTDERTNTYVFRFGNGYTDADYTVSASITDAAGNVSSGVDYGASNPQNTFTIDQVAPVLSATYINGSGSSVSAGENVQGQYYDRQSMSVIINVLERNFAENGLSVSASATNAIGAKIAAGVEGTWSGTTSDGHSYRIQTYTQDGIYTVYAEYTDLAGNKTTYTQHYFTVDKTAPVGTMTISGQSNGNPVSAVISKFVEIVTFGIFTNKTMTVTQTSTDETSGIDRIQYYLYTPDVEARGSFRGLTLSQLASLPWKDWTGELKISPNTQVIVYERIIDKAGNITYLNSQQGIIADDTAPDSPVITFTAPAPQNGIYNSDVPFTVSVTDPARGGTYAGLKSVKWSVLRDGAVTQSGSYDGEFTDPSARRQSVTHNETISATENNSNNVRVVIEAEDYAGNKSKSEKNLSIDVTKPHIEVVYDRNDPINELYYNSTRTATVRVTERNFDPSLVEIDTGSKTKAKIGQWQGSSSSSDMDLYTCSVEFSEDDDYTVTVKAKDRAGNLSDYSRKDHFIVDTTKPVISVLYDNTNDDEGLYYNEPRTAVIAVKDANFNERDFTSDIKAVLDGEEIKGPETEEWVHKNGMHSTMLTFSEDADYSYVLNCTDLAGNKAEEFTQERFVIDRTKPTIVFRNIEDKSANRGEVKPLIEYADLNFNAKGIVVKLKGVSHEEYEITGEITSDDKNKASFQAGDIAHEKGMDDIYTLTAEVTDLAGNVAEKSITFSVNRFGSVYTFSEETREFLDKYYMQEPEELTIYETNIDGLKSIGVMVGLNGETTKLRKGVDYTAEEMSTEKGWSVWEYNIKAKCFEDEGLYEVRVESVDDAGNRQDNSLKEKPIAFAIDRTPPSVVMTGIEDAQRYAETSREISVMLSDNIAIGSANVMINGKLAEEFKSVDIDANGGRILYSLKGTDEWQSVEIVAYDAAGNEARTGKRTVFVSANKFRQFIENKPVFYGTIAGVSAIAGAAAAFLIMRRKKKIANGKGKTKDLERPEGDSDDLQ